MANPNLTPTEITSMLFKSLPQVIITSPKGLPIIKEAILALNNPTVTERFKKGGRLFIVDLDVDDYGLPFSSAPPTYYQDKNWFIQDHKSLLLHSYTFNIAPMCQEECARRVANVLWSSGTGGKSKGVLQSHLGLIWTALAQWLGNKEYTGNEVRFSPSLSLKKLMNVSRGSSVSPLCESFGLVLTFSMLKWRIEKLSHFWYRHFKYGQYSHGSYLFRYAPGKSFIVYSSGNAKIV